MKYEKPIIAFIQRNGVQKLFRDNLEKSTFLVLADTICGIVEGNVRGNEYDLNDVVEDVYNYVFVPIVRNLIEANNVIRDKFIAYTQRDTRPITLFIPNERMNELSVDLKEMIQKYEGEHKECDEIQVGE